MDESLDVVTDFSGEVCSESRARVLADIYLGMPDRYVLKVTARKTIYNDRVTPCLYKIMTGRTAWNLLYRVGLPHRGNRGITSMRLRLRLVVDDYTGELLRITCGKTSSLGWQRSRVDGGHTTLDLRSRGEVYLKLPAEAPAIAFWKALEILCLGKPELFFEAREVCAQYVLYKNWDIGACRAWELLTRRCAGIRVTGERVSDAEKAQDVHRTMICAHDGAVLRVNPPRLFSHSQLAD